jgi:rhamnulokinase
MWLVKQCLEAWATEGRAWTVEELVKQAAGCTVPPGIINVDAEPLLLSGEMPQRISRELAGAGHKPIPDIPGNEPLFARVIFESLATRYAAALADLERMLGRKLACIHIIGGASRNLLLATLTSERTGLPVQCGHPESSTIGNFAVQLAATEDLHKPLTREGIRFWANRLCKDAAQW